MRLLFPGSASGKVKVVPSDALTAQILGPPRLALPQAQCPHSTILASPLQFVKISPKARGKICLLGDQDSQPICFGFLGSFPPRKSWVCTSLDFPLPFFLPATLINFTRYTFDFLILPPFHLSDACSILARIIHHFIPRLLHTCEINLPSQ